MPDRVSFMREAVQLAQDNRVKGAQPFGAVLTRDGQRIATGLLRNESDNPNACHRQWDPRKQTSDGKISRARGSEKVSIQISHHNLR